MEKVGKRVFKMKPSKSGINKLPLFCQFRPACKKLGSSDETFCRTWKFSAKWYMYIFYSTSAREGPLPLPNCFFCYTRPSRGQGCVVFQCFKVFALRVGEKEQRSTHSQKEHPAGALFARKLSQIKFFNLHNLS